MLLFGYGLYSCYDGFYHYPNDNAAAVARGLKVMPHPGFDIPFNRAFGLGLPPLSLALLGWSLYVSRGRVPPGRGRRPPPARPPADPACRPSPASTAASGTQGHRLRRLPRHRHGYRPGQADDFVYQRQPTDWIFDRVIAAVEGPARRRPGRCR